MMSKRAILATAFAVSIGSAVLAIAQERKDAPTTPATAPSAQNQQTVAAVNSAISASTHASDAASSRPLRTSVLDERAMRIEGEKRFQTNCGRCHMAPHKFPPREMATIVRHMRVRAMITDEDMRLILRYMTE
jgi:mono/diheme cytochrome c family protein